MTKKVFTRVAAEFFFINLTEFFKQSLHLKNYSISTFLGWKTKSLIFHCSMGENRKFLRINLLVEIFCLYVNFFETKNIYSHTHSTYAAGYKIFTWPISGKKTTTFVLASGNIYIYIYIYIYMYVYIYKYLSIYRSIYLSIYLRFEEQC